MLGIGNIGKLGRLGQSANKSAAKRILDIFSTSQVATNVQIPLTLNTQIGKTVYIDLGDGSSLVECVGTSNYTTAGDFNVKLSGNYSSITGFKIINTNAVITFPKGIKNLKNIKSLNSFHLSNLRNLTASCKISDFPRVTGTFHLFNLPNFTATGLIIDFPRATSNFNLFNLPNFTATGLIIDFPRATSNFYLQNLPKLTATGLISDFPRITFTFSLFNVPNLTATGNISTLPPLTANNSTLSITNCPKVNLTIDTPPVWKNTTIKLQVALTTTQLNDFVKLWAPVTEAGGVKNVNIAGNNEPLTESDPDVAAALQILSDKNKILAYNI